MSMTVILIYQHTVFDNRLLKLVLKNSENYKENSEKLEVKYENI
jgi:hypothetical protein